LTSLLLTSLKDHIPLLKCKPLTEETPPIWEWPT
jgi:hypothetical protein